MAAASKGTGRPDASTHVEVDGRRLRLTNLDKVLYPAIGFTKAQVIDYYSRVAEAMLPHLAGRPVTMVRCPDGVDGERFFEKRCPGHRPRWLPTVPLDADSDVHACSVRDRAGLVWIANLAALELHTPQARADDPWHPTAVVFDLDPGAPAGIVECARVALDVRDLLGHLGLTAVAKTSGSKGIHVSVGLRASVDADTTKSFARAIGSALARRDSRRVTVDMARERRRGKVFVDWSQNDRHKTTVCAYSLRATPIPSVSTPVTWDELEAVATTGNAQALDFDPATVLERVGHHGDLYASSLAGDQDLPALA